MCYGPCLVRVYNLKDDMAEWDDRKLPVVRVG
jgi:hypothetical protein